MELRVLLAIMGIAATMSIGLFVYFKNKAAVINRNLGFFAICISLWNTNDLLFLIVLNRYSLILFQMLSRQCPMAAL